MLEKEERAPVEQQEQQRNQLLLTIAITVIAVLIGSILFQKKGWKHQKAVTLDLLLVLMFPEYKSVFWCLFYASIVS